ncbi:alpha/beta fold hydrolase [Paremcibacter congregatus]|uniref:Alpha/beta hydrolase n=1 Tax=Paremcibacter congregatus TaxID=2043170 RepID=A0A2G4YU77_9PROT|nr:alpha/beta hydrolase [Paremcibacter congregatus]PHZ85843.1 alpha/beta hydrolase [Paremcibacter congregatus]QDE26806.1 alpha/beta hydrolase [Paremcibacter congregatus]
MEFEEKYYTSQDGLTLYYRDYASGENTTRPPLLCLHGLTRNSKDFHQFALKMRPSYRVISLDMRGRGQSDYDPVYVNYQIPTYVQDVQTLLKKEGLSEVVAVGTSMGGLISMTLGVLNPSVLKGIILNDIGPEIDPKGIARISQYLGKNVPLKNWSHAVMGVKTISGPLFPDYSADEWEEFTRNSFRQRDDGQIVADYDPHIGTAIAESAENAVPPDLWPLFGALAPIPIMTLRGEASDILSADTLNKMAERHPEFTKVTIANRAHTPDLREAHSQEVISSFLNKLNG